MKEATANFRSFPLAVLVAATMFWIALSLGVVAGAITAIDHGALAGLNAILPFVLAAAIYAVFYVTLVNGSKVAATLFAVLGLWNFFGAINGSTDVVGSIMDIISGVLGVVGIAGVLKGFRSMAIP